MATTALLPSSSLAKAIEQDRTRSLVAAVKEVALAISTGRDARSEIEAARAVIERTEQQDRTIQHR